MGDVAIRDAYGEALKKLGRLKERVVVLEADVGSSTKSGLFGKEFPERYFNVGISELNMVNMAAGLALTDKIPFVNTFAIFMTTRASDPIQSLIAYDSLNVKLAGTYCGLSDSYDGASHQAITDIAIMRTIPNMTVVSVADPVETEKAVFAIAEYDGPVYLRLSRAPAPTVFDDSYQFELGKGVVVKDGEDVTLISTGTLLHNCLAAAEALAAEGISAAVVHIHTIKPIDEKLVVRYARKTGAIVTVEEHSICGGLGGAVVEVLAGQEPTVVEMVGATSFGESGDYQQLLEKYGYGPGSIAEKCKAAIGRK